MHEYMLLMCFNPRIFAKDDKLTCLCQELNQNSLKTRGKGKVDAKNMNSKFGKFLEIEELMPKPRFSLISL